MLPNLLIVGPPKSGTTALRNILNQHPDVFTVPKEIHFFDENFKKGIEWYEKFFDGWKGEKIVTEKTPAYFYDRDAPERVKKILPNVKLIFIFRNPVRRAYSHYWHNVRIGAEERNFEKAIEDELKTYDTFDIKYRRFSTHSKEWEKKDSGIFRYIGISAYSVFLKKWLSFFGRKKCYFMLLENLSEEMEKIIEFLEIKEYQFIIKRHNVGGAPRSRILIKVFSKIGYIPKISEFILHKINTTEYPSMKEETRQKLQRYFEPYNKELEKLTGLDLSEWEK